MKSISHRAWARFFMIARPFFASELRWSATGLLGLLVAFVGAISWMFKVRNDKLGELMTAASEQQQSQFYASALLFTGVLVLLAVAAVFKTFTEERFVLLWRGWLTTHLIERYLGGRAYHRLNARGDIDNPDQRIAEDVRTFTGTTLSLVLIALNSGITLSLFSSTLWSITPWLVLAAVLYAGFGSLFTVVFGRRLVGLNFDQLHKEADLRYDLIQVRENAEPVALLRGEWAERARLLNRLGEVLGNMRSIVGFNRNLGFFTNGFSFLTPLVPLLIVAPLYFRGQVKFGAVPQAMDAFLTLLNAFSIIVTDFPKLSSIAADTARLGLVWEALDEEALAGKPGIETVEDATRVAYERLTLVTPRDGRVLLKDLTLEVPAGQRLLIMGPKGVGRTSLLRATAGLWTRGTGQIYRPDLRETMFLPQKPYLVRGSLRDQLCYAVPEGRDIADERLLAALHRLKLDAVVERAGGLDAEREWANVLTLGEQQLVAIARLLLAKPRFAFLDDVTANLDATRGREVYRILSRTEISYVSVASDPALMEYHDLLLELYPNGPWRSVAREEAVSA